MNHESRLFYVTLPVAFVAIGYLFSAGSDIFLWIICSYFLFAIIDPWMSGLTRRGVPPVIAALFLVIISSGILYGLGFLIYRSSVTLIDQVGNYKTAIFHYYQKTTSGMTAWVNTFSHTANLPVDPETASNAVRAATSVNDPAASIPKTLGDGVLSGLSSVLNLLTFVALTPLLTFFMIAEQDLFGHMCNQILKNEEKARKITKAVNGVINSYFLGNFGLILVSFPVFALVFWLVGVHSYVSLGLISAIFNLVPFLGFILASVLPILDLLTNGGHLPGVFILLGSCFFTHFLVANVITPKILGSKVDLNATVSTIGLIAWGHMWGAMGLLLAIPITAILKIFFQHSSIAFFQHCAALMSENPKSLHLQGLKFIPNRLQKKV